METSLVLLKPDTVNRSNIGNVIGVLERKGFTITGMKMMQLDEDVLREHYPHVANEPFFPRILKYMTGTPVIAMAIAGKDAVLVIRSIIGLTNPADSAPGSTRGDFGHNFNTTVLHASDSLENANRELNIFFSRNEIFNYRT